MSIIPKLTKNIQVHTLDGVELIENLNVYQVLEKEIKPNHLLSGTPKIALQILAVNFYLGDESLFISKNLWEHSLCESIEQLNNTDLESLYIELGLMTPDDDFYEGGAISPGRRITDYNTGERLNEWRMISYVEGLISVYIERDIYRMKISINKEHIKAKLYNELDIKEEYEVEDFEKRWKELIS